MNLLLLDDASLGAAVAVAADRYRQRDEAWPPPPGRQLRVGLVNGPMGTATVTGSNNTTVNLQIDTLDDTPPPSLPLTLILALPRPKMLRRVLRSATELGVKQIYLVNSYRVEKSYWQSPLLASERIREYLWAGLEQACDSTLPSVHLKKRFKPFVEDELPKICAGSKALVAHPDGDQMLPAALNSAVTLAVGPEGGFIDYEVELLKAQGFVAGSLGPRILRVETAVPTLISRLFS